MSRISDAIVEQLLDEITDYDSVSLTDQELSELKVIADQWRDEESIETEINLYLQKIGYFYNDNHCVWTRTHTGQIINGVGA